MNLHQLYVFKVVVETGSFSKTASEVRIAQSAISYHIKMLEAEVGEPSVFRSIAHVSRLKKERCFWKHVEKIFVAVEEAKRDSGWRSHLPTSFRIERVHVDWDDLHFLSTSGRSSPASGSTLSNPPPRSFNC